MLLCHVGEDDDDASVYAWKHNHGCFVSTVNSIVITPVVMIDLLSNNRKSLDNNAIVLTIIYQSAYPHMICSYSCFIAVMCVVRDTLLLC